MKKSTQFILILLSLGILTLLVWGGVVFYRYLTGQLNTLDQQGSATVVLMTVVLLASAGFIAWSVRSSMEKIIRGFQPERGNVYHRFVKLWTNNSRLGTKPEEWGEEWNSWQKEMALWGGDRVLRQYGKLQRELDRSKPDDAATQALAERVVLEMRRDLGARNVNFSMKEWKRLLT